MGNFSLDDFDGDDAEDETAEADSETAETSDTDTLATYRWTPEATACPRCETPVQKRWLDGDEYVCNECKDW